MSLAKIVDVISECPRFARFFARMVCKANSGDADAKTCVEKFYKPLPRELTSLCIPEAEHARLMKCTDQNLLIGPIAYKIAKGGFRKRR